MRFERKIQLNPKMIGDLRFWMSSNGLLFKRKYKDRRVNSIYFDDYDLNSLFSNEAGISSREKVRLRWYGDNELVAKSFTLEIKQRKNIMGSKVSEKIAPFPLFGQRLKSIGDEIRQRVPEEIARRLSNYRVPTSIISYDREYFESPSGIRITIDTNMRYKNLYCKSVLPQRLDRCRIYGVAEIKYPDLATGVAMSQLPDFLFRIGKNSKYANSLNNI